MKRLFSLLCALCATLMLATPVCAAKSIDGMANPIKEYTSLRALRKAVDFSFVLPKELPSGYEEARYSAISGTLAQVDYVNAKDHKIIARAMRGSEDISGDYNVYKKTYTHTINKIEVTVKGNTTASARLAIWEHGGNSYSLSFEAGIKLATLEKIIGGMTDK